MVEEDKSYVSTIAVKTIELSAEENTVFIVY